jgi:hypothetical protein
VPCREDEHIGGGIIWHEVRNSSREHDGVLQGKLADGM